MTADQLRQLRLLLKDTNPDNQVFTDQNLTDFWTIEDGVLKCAAACALETIAQDSARTLLYIKTTGLETNGKAAAEGILATAQNWRAQARQAAIDAAGSSFGFAEVRL